MTKPTVLHLIDDTTAGGVTRVVDHIITSPDLAQDAEHRLMVVDGNWGLLRHIEADAIVSHLSVNWRNLPQFLALRLRNPRARLIHVEHSYTEAFVRLNVRHKTRFALLLRLAYHLFDSVAAVSFGQGEWLSRIRAVPARKLTVIRSFVDLSAFAALATARGPIRVIGAIGRLEAQKGFDDLIMQFRRSHRSDLELHIFGTGTEEGRLMALADGDPRIKFMGFAKDPVIAMAKVDAVVMPSRWEAYGLVAIEALAARRPLFVNGIDGLSDHKAWGAIEVPADKPNGWQDAINRMPKTVQSKRDQIAHKVLKEEFLNAWKAQLISV